MKRKNPEHTVLAFAFLLLIWCSGNLPIVGLQKSSQSLSSNGTVTDPPGAPALDYQSVRPIFLVFPPFTATNTAVIGNVISATHDLTAWFDVGYYVHYDHWSGNLSKLEELMSIYAGYGAKVAVMIIHGWDTPDYLDGMMVLTPDQIASLKQEYDNFAGLVIAEYLTKYPENSTILSRYEIVLETARANDLWVAHEEEWWTWGCSSDIISVRMNFTVVSPVIQRFSDVIIPVTKTNGASVQYWSWGVNMGYSVAFGTRWGIVNEANYWYEVRAKPGQTYNASLALEMPVDVMINSAIYALMHNATYLRCAEPPAYFFNADGEPSNAFLKFKEALFRYFENSAPKVILPKICILNLPIRFEPKRSVTQTGVIVTNQHSFTTDLFSYPSWRHANVSAKNIQKYIYDFNYDPMGLVNTKALMAVLPWGTPMTLLRRFQLVLVQIPSNIDPVYNSTYVTNPQEVYNYLLEASQYVDLFIPQALVFATNVTAYYDSMLAKVIHTYTHINHSALTGLNPPYTMRGVSWSKLDGTKNFNVTIMHEKYTKCDSITTNAIVASILPTGLMKNARPIGTVNGTPFMWQYTNDYGRNIYTIFDTTNSELRDVARNLIGEFISMVTVQFFDELSYFGAVLYHIEYDPVKYNTLEMAVRPTITYSINIKGNATILYALSVTYDDDSYMVQVSSNYPYAFVVYTN